MLIWAAIFIMACFLIGSIVAYFAHRDEKRALLIFPLFIGVGVLIGLGAAAIFGVWFFRLDVGRSK